MSSRVFLVPLWLRIWHWTNAVLILTLIVTGISLHFAAPDAPLIPFDLARLAHNTAGISLGVVYVLYAVANGISGNWRQYIPRPTGLVRRVLRQSRFYGVGIFERAAHPFPVTPAQRFNPLQQLTYLAIVYGGLPLLVVTGLWYLFPEFAPETVLGWSGLWAIALAHYLIGLGVVVFLIGHIYMATFGKTLTSDLWMMITGWHEKEDDDDRQIKT